VLGGTDNCGSFFKVHPRAADWHWWPLKHILATCGDGKPRQVQRQFRTFQKHRTRLTMECKLVINEREHRGEGVREFRTRKIGQN
jgi:hypothetical protein